MPSVINGRSLILSIYLLELMRHDFFFFSFSGYTGSSVRCVNFFSCGAQAWLS